MTLVAGTPRPHRAPRSQLADTAALFWRLSEDVPLVRDCALRRHHPALRRNLGRMDFSSDDVALVLVWDPAFPVMREALLAEVVIVDCVRIRLHDLNGATNMRKMFLKSATIQIARGTSLLGIEIIPNSSSRAKIIWSQSWPYH